MPGPGEDESGRDGRRDEEDIYWSRLGRSHREDAGYQSDEGY